MGDSPRYNNYPDGWEFTEKNILTAKLQVIEVPVLLPNALKSPSQDEVQQSPDQESNDSISSELLEVGESSTIFSRIEQEKILTKVIQKSHQLFQGSVHWQRLKKEMRFVINEIGYSLITILKRKIIKYWKRNGIANSEPLLSFFVNVCGLPPSQLLSNGGHELKLFHNIYFGNGIPLRLARGLFHTSQNTELEECDPLHLMHHSYVGTHVILPEFDKVLCEFIGSQKAERADVCFKVLGQMIEEVMGP